jgi:hypothetical protein
MVLNRWGDPSDSTTADVFPDDRTAAESRTTWGRPLRVSLSRVAPPAISYICYNDSDGPNSEDGGGDDDKQSAYDDPLYVVAAHGDSVLVKLSVPCRLRRRLGIGILDAATDYFLYRAATAATGQPPSLSLLPACHIPMYGREYSDEDPFHMERVFDVMDTGLILRSGGGDDGGEVLVAQLQVTHQAPFDTAELCVLRPGRRDWELKVAVPIVHSNEVGEGRHDLGEWQELNAAVPVGNRFLCWVNYDRSTFLVCDMAEEENPKLRYVPLPVPPKEEWDDVHVEPLSWQYYWSIGAAPSAGVPAVRFVSIDKRRCSGAPLIKSLCERSSSAFVVTTWTMALKSTGEPMEWVKEGVLHCEELWAAVLAAGYEDIPRVRVSCPTVSSENPNVVCFMADDIDSETNGNTKSWTLEVHMRRKTLISVVSSCPYDHPIQWDVCVNYGKPFVC